MNSSVHVDAEEGEKAAQRTPKMEPQSSSSSAEDKKGSVVLVLPPKDIAPRPSTSDDCVPVMVNDIPVYISQTSTGSPLYIRQYPPTLEEIMVSSPEEVFDGFSEASGQTFEGFSEASCGSVLFEGFSEGASEASVPFEGFVELAGESKAAVIQSLVRMISTEDSKDSDGDDSCEGTSWMKCGSVATRRSSGSHKRKRSQRKDSPEKRLPKRVKMEKTPNNRSEATKTVVPRRRVSVEKQESQPETSYSEQIGKIPRNLHLPSPGDANYIGEFCNAVGCTVSFLERMAIKDVKINNGIVLELLNFATRISWEKEYVVRWIQRLSGMRTNDPLDEADYKSVQAILKRRKALSTIHSGNPHLRVKLRSFDMMEYVLPSMVKRQVKLEDGEGVSASDKPSDPETKQGGMAEKDREEKGARKGVKRLSDAKEKKTSDGTNAVDESNIKEEKESESTTERDITTDRNNRGPKIKEEQEKQIPEKVQKSDTSGKTNKEAMSERRISTRRASLLALREEREKPSVKQERTDEGSAEVSISRSGRIRILPKYEKQRRVEEAEEDDKPAEKKDADETSKEMKGNKTADGTREREVKKKGKDADDDDKATTNKDVMEHKTADKTIKESEEIDIKEEEISEQEGKMPVASQAKTEAASGRRISSRRASVLKAREEKEKRDTKETSERAKNNQRQSRGSRTISGSEDSKTEVRDAIDTECKTTDERRKRTAARRESDTSETHNKKITEASSQGRVSTRRDSHALVKEEDVKHSPDSEMTQKTDKVNTIRTRRSSLFVKEEEGNRETKKTSEGASKDRPKETASKPLKEAGEGRRTRRGSILVARQEEGKKTKEIEKESEKVSVGNEEEEDKEEKTDEVEKGKEEKELDIKEDKATKLDDSQSSVEEKSEEGKTSLTSPGKDDAYKSTPAEEHESPGKEGTSSEENQFILKRNKVINRDKRISRWQNKKMAQHEEPKTSGVEDIAIRDSANSDGMKEDKETHQNGSACDDGVLSDDGSACSLVIDESDDDSQVDEGNGTALSNASEDTPRDDTGEDVLMPVLRERKAKVCGDVSSEEDRKEQLPSTPKDGTNIKPEKSPSKEKAAATPASQGGESAYAGTLGVSKSGRLRKPSAKGIQSIEIKCLFMQRNGEAPRPPPPLPLSKDDQKDKDWMEERRSPVKRELRESNWMPERRYPNKHEPGKRDGAQEKRSVKSESKDEWKGDKDGGQDKESPLKRKFKVKKNLPMGIHFNKTDNEFLTYTYHDGHLVPKFKERDFYLGDYCAKAGVTVDDLNSENAKSKLTFGMIRELYDFYVSRKATKTALAIKLFKLQGKEMVDNTHLLSTVMRITNLAKMKHSRNVPYDREFRLPVRLTSHSSPTTTTDLRNRKASGKSTSDEPLPHRVRKSPKKRGVKPEDSGDEYEYFGDMEEDAEEESDILLTRGTDGTITRGDIVFLYSKWLSSKMSAGSNTFVTDLLRSVEQLMAERTVAPLRIPAGTLMSSSVKLYDEYKQILRISKEDAIMYLQEDWLEDIQYLLSISAPSRRNTSEGETAPGASTESDTPTTAPEKPSKTRAPRHRSGGNKEEKTSEYEGETPASAVKEEVSRSHQMESVGKRLGKRRNVRESLDKFEKEILEELEKTGGLEEEEEDTLQQIDQERSFEDPPIKEEVKVEKKQKEKKKVEKSDQKPVTRSQRDVKPADRDFNCEVKKIIDYQEIHDSLGRRFRYLVRWVGFGPQDDSWVDEANLQCPEILTAFWKHRRRGGKSEASKNRQGETEPVELESLLSEPKDDDESIIQVMVKQAAMHDAVRSDNTAIVTKREFLGLYDAWREENQEELMAGGTNTVNLQVFKARIRDLMTSRGLPFHPESILNAAFMMTLMKTRLQNQVAINKFLDSSCLEALEASRKQYLKRKYSEIGVGLTQGRLKDQKPSILSLQKDLHSLKLDLTTAQKWRAVKNSQLGAVEEEVDCLEIATPMSNDDQKAADALLYLKQEVHKLKCDLKVLERTNHENTNGKPKAIQVPLFADVTRDAESYRTKGRLVRDKLLNMSMPKSTVDTIMDIVARRMGGRVQE